MPPVSTTSTSWASRRKAIYLWSTILLLTLISWLIFWKFWYRSPTCFDHIQNGDETGLDCGGSCSLVCSAQALAPVMRSDPRIFQVYPGIYSLLTFVENHNVNSSAANVPYKFKIYDANGKAIAERDGTTSLLKNKTTAIFEGNLLLSTSTPERVTFELSPNIVWTKDLTKTPEIKIEHSTIQNIAISPRIDATITNNSIQDFKNIEIVAVILDGKDNAIAASRTAVDLLRKGEKQDLFFTWPKPFQLSQFICEKPERVVLDIDRSGSMASISQNPPEPLTAVKQAASDFISNLKDGDKAALLSFSSTASSPPDYALTDDFAALKSAVSNVFINKDGLQYTNIADALHVSKTILEGDDKATANKVIVLLTDGVANKPASPESSSEAADIAYAENAALTEAGQAKSENIQIYTIGLGKDIHQDFLSQIASVPENLFLAPTSSELQSIYKKIASSICEEVPARIELLWKID